MKHAAHIAGYVRIARYLNYTRSLPSPTTARVDIPGLPFEAFTPDGTKIKPWSLVRLVESVRLFVSLPVSHTEHPARSLLELHKLVSDYLFITVGARLDIERRFHDPETPKFPLYMHVELEHVGSSSKRIGFQLRHAVTDELYATCQVDNVLVTANTHQKASFPDWWMDKYASLCTGQKSGVLKLDTTKDGNVPVCDRHEVQFSDTDPYGHTNWSTYVKFVFNCFQRNVENRKFLCFNNIHVNTGMKSMQMAYKSETKCGDILKMESWDTIDTSTGPVLNCHVTNGGKSCFQSRTSFYS